MDIRKILTASAVLLMLTGCGGNVPSGTAAETAVSSGSSSAAESAPETEAVSLPRVTHTPICTGICDYIFYREDSSVDADGYRSFPNAIMRLSSGMYADSGTSPELFDSDALTYSGERADLGTVVLIKAGDRIGSLTAVQTSAELEPPKRNGEYDTDASEGYSPFRTYAAFDGELTLSGVLRYYSSERSGCFSGDLVFIPDDSYKGLPVPVDFSGNDTVFGVSDFDTSPDGLHVYSDTPVLRIGNLYADYSDDPAMFELLGGGNEDCTKRVKLTLTDLRLEWDVQGHAGRGCTARLKNAGEQE